MLNPNLDKNKEIIFPLEIVSIIEEILIKFGLKIDEEEILRRMSLAKSEIEAERIFESEPGAQLAKIVREIGENKIFLDDLENIIQERLNVSEEIAKGIVEEFKKKILPFISEKKPKISLPHILFGEKLPPPPK